MDTTKMPFEEKVFEAWRAIADDRFTLHDDFPAMNYTRKWRQLCSDRPGNTRHSDKMLYSQNYW